MTDAPAAERWYTASDIAEMTGLDKSTIYRWWTSGKLPCIEIYGQRRMTARQFAELQAALEARAKRGKISAGG